MPVPQSFLLPYPYNAEGTQVLKTIDGDLEGSIEQLVHYRSTKNTVLSLLLRF
jgi:hypothetical protein